MDTQFTYNDNITIIYTKKKTRNEKILTIEARKNCRKTSTLYIHIQTVKQTQGRKGHKYSMLGWYLLLEGCSGFELPLHFTARN